MPIRPLPVLLLLCGTAQGLFTVHRVPHPTIGIAQPSAAQLRWMDLELGAMISYGIGMPNAPWVPPNTTCFGNFSAPPAGLFNCTPNFAQWTRAFQALGAKYSVIAASGGCGYALWPSQAKFPDGTTYNYSTAQSPLLGMPDIMRAYVDAMTASNIGTGVYFQLEYDYWGGFLHGSMSPNGPGAPKLSAEEYFNVTTQMLAEVWDPDRYGNHTELWFDGGLVGWSASAVAAVAALMKRLQPGAVAFQGESTCREIQICWQLQAVSSHASYRVFQIDFAFSCCDRSNHG
jgi:alpha-L-fucosidase